MKGWISHLSFPQKMAAIIVASTIPIVLLSVLFFRSQQNDIQQTALEIGGMTMYHPVEEMLAPVGEHEVWAAAAASGDPAGKTKARAAAEEAAKQVAEMDALSAVYGAPDGEDRRRWNEVKAKFNDVVAASPGSVAEVQKQHDELRTKMLDYRNYVVTTSHIVLDQQAVSYYLLRAATVELPDFEQHFSEMRTAAAAIGAAGQPSTALVSDVVEAQVLAERALESIKDDLRLSREASGANDEHTSDASAKLEKLTAAFQSFVKYCSENVTTGTFSSPVDDILSQSSSMADLVDTLHGEMHGIGNDLLNARLSSLRTSRAIVFSIVALALLAGLGFTLLVALNTIEGLRQAGEVANKLAEGDYTHGFSVHGRDELSRMMKSLHDMKEKVSQVLRGVKESADAVAVASREINAGTLDLSQRTEQQAANLEETASSMEEMTATVRQNADNARLANQLAQAARDQAEHGGQVVQHAVSAMSAIDSSSKKIADIIAVIDEIAFQTNLLALNAAVEAARAGDQGRGFAVVASEVRSLAQRSASAAKEIKDLINDSVGKVEEGSRLVSESGRHLEEIVASVKKVSDVVGEISNASQEQAVSAEEISRAVLQMDQGTQQNAAMVEQASAAAQSMNEQADKLMSATAYFRIEGVEADPRRGAVAAVAVPARPATRPAVERRAAARPWSQPAARPAAATRPAAAAAAVARPKAVANGADANDWSEF
ncbi:MAG: methyl-accepting chemotaxis protein [Steroidobacteraceae bacterium]